VHVVALHRLAQAAVAQMVARGSGTIINVASVASFVSSAGNVNYCATKTYQRIYSEALARELEGTGVYVQVLCPGFTHTEFHGRGGMDKSKIPEWLWLSAERVVDESLAAMRRGRPTVVIPGLRYRLIVFVLRYAPMALIRRASGRYSRR
jgi:short-subunit dehydrogenase